MTEEPKKRRSLEEITADIEAISEDPSHRDQFKALRMLAAEKSSSITLPEPMGDGEIVERLIRLMKPAGRELCQQAYARAFHRAKDTVATAPTLRVVDLTDDQKDFVLEIRNLKQLYRAFPEIKRHGVPTGYPSGRGIEIQQEWCRTKAGKMLIDRDQAAMNRAEETDKEIRDGDSGPQPAA